MNKEEKLILFKQIEDIRYALEKLGGSAPVFPLRWGGNVELNNIIKKLEAQK